jgi:hypothetical protein
MSYQAAEQRALTVVERQVRADDPKLASMFGIFTELDRRDGLPPLYLPRGPARRLSRAALARLARALRGRRAVGGPAKAPPPWADGSPRRPHGVWRCARGHRLGREDIVRGWLPCGCRPAGAGPAGHHLMCCAFCLAEGESEILCGPECPHQPLPRRPSAGITARRPSAGHNGAAGGVWPIVPFVHR